ncbi:hypothetical protein BGZ96_010415 [Linnemannia gamsii]|uniref:VLRF1 domain-containing protein n=1 Tax=Linnemannia gamsii TaxID=64522 RepID=A0ABQ7KBX6_9FUNG|nr:hypothetical protein BGZ96_010415 [Linnemannia gamsii]
MNDNSTPSNLPTDDNVHATVSSTSAHTESKSTAKAGPATPMSLFFLPQDLITSLVPQAPTDTLGLLPPVPLEPTHDKSNNADADNTTAQKPAVATSLDSAVPSCRICGIANLESVEKQREHVRLDWHRYNLKQQLLDKSARPITEQQFENMIQDLSSISGSDTDDSDDDEKRTSAATAGSNNSTAVNSIRTAGAASGSDQEALIQSLMKKLELTVKQNQNARNQDPVLVLQQQVLEQQLQEARSSPFVWFTSTLYDETVRLGIYKNALPNRGLCEDVAEYLKTVQFAVAPIVKKQKNNKLRREAKRAAAAAAAAAGAEGEVGAGQEQEPQQAIAKQDSTPAPVTQPDAEDDDDDDEEEEEQDQDWIKYQLQAKQNQPTASIQPPKQARYWTLILIGGGHFAGIVMDLAGQVSSHGRDMKVVAHKTFHRYTVRKKQGGSQAAHGVANSAGARIRMYNEEALKLEVRELLEGWSHWIKQSECVFVHSPGNNKKVLFYDNSVLSAAEKQGRLRSIPFITRRPTLTELKRAFVELTTVKVSVLTKEALERQAQAEQDALERAQEASAAATTKDQQGDSAKTVVVIPEAPAELLKLIELVKKGRAEAMSTHLLKHGIDPSQLLPLSTSTEYDIRRTPTILHLAAHHGQAQVVKLLLEKHNADPTTTTLSAAAKAAAAGDDEEDEESESMSTGSSFTAYDIAKDKETRNAFRRAMALSPENWDWVGLAHVPSALTPEMEAEQERKAKEKTRKLLDAERERKKTRETTSSPNSRPGTPTGTIRSGTTAPTTPSSSLLGKNLATATSANSQLSPEMRMRLERERRANAAEVRMVALKQQDSVRQAVREGKNVCVACGKSLDGLTPFDKFGRKFCTTDCVAKGPA